jgi:WD40 repeat protein
MWRIGLFKFNLLLSVLFAAVAVGQTSKGQPVAADPLPKGALLRMGSSRLAHGNWLTSVRFSVDDRWVGTADADGAVRVWEAATGKLLWERPNRTGRTLAFSPDGRTLAMGGPYNRAITLWDLLKNESVLEITQDGAAAGQDKTPRSILEIPLNVRALEFSKDGAYLAAVGLDKIPRLWDAKSGKLVMEFKGHESELFAVALSPDGSRLASGGGERGRSENNEIRIWETATGREVTRLNDVNEHLKRLPDAIYSLEFSPDGKTLGSAGAYIVRLWDIERRKVVQRLTNCSYDIAFSSVDNTFVAPGDFGIYDLETGEQRFKLSGDVRVHGHVEYSHDGQLIVSGNQEGYVQFWNAKTGQEIVRRSGHEGGIRSVAISPDGSIAASVSRQDGTIRVWGMASGSQLAKIPVTWRGSDVWWNEEGSHIQFAPYGRELFTWTYDSTIRYWKPDNSSSRTLQAGKTSATAMAFSQDGTRAAVVEYNGGSRSKIGIYELDGGALVTALDPYGESSSDPWVSALAFSPDGKQLAVGVLKSSLQETPLPSVQLWDIQRAQIIRRLRPAVAPPGHLCFSPDGTLLATSAVRDAPLQLWRVSDGVEVRSFKVEADAHGRDPAPIVFSPDGKRLAAADANRDIYVWELATGEKIRTFQGHQKAVTSLAFSPDGKTLLSGSEDATMLLWDIAGAGQAALRLTREQLRDYWDALADADAGIAASAGNALLCAPEDAVELFAERLNAGEVRDVRELPKLIAELSGDDAKASLQAESRLKSFGNQASGSLFMALAEKPPLAARRRIEQVLRSIGEFPIPPETLQRTRAIQLLEQIGSDSAAKILKKLADTQPPTTSSVDATAALQRLQVRLRAPKPN